MVTCLKQRIIAAGVAALVLLSLLPLAMAQDVPRMTKEELKSRMESGDVVVLDVRSGRDWDSSEFKIKGALRPAGKDVKAWAESYAKDKTTVLYCA